ncbi:putative metalloprotease CJM1_0395 family protein [Desulfatibacillum aliphaticivorans]|uniref:putative metalloprotease CJM1_0395 family protein n=1 Tax=Desulfatibacillum aliphaticivorans TaxID=218208 RepID=UPI0003FE9820|nr:putative metalloprotease CJM1_0395 family protein [Desulfatibacillum aliphaticivorans]
MEIFASQAALAYMAYMPSFQNSGAPSKESEESNPYDVKDKVSISREAADLYQNIAGHNEMEESEFAEEAGEAGEGSESGEARDAEKMGKSAESSVTNEAELSEGEKEMVRELQARDKEVRAHEAAHMAAGGGVVKSGATFSYQQGPDGKRYAVGGEVQVDTSRESEPEATLQKMQQVKRAALAPASPSGQDRSVAARAARIMMEARAEVAEQAKAESEAETTGETEESTETENAAEAAPADSEGRVESAEVETEEPVEQAAPQPRQRAVSRSGDVNFGIDPGDFPTSG